MKIDQSFIVLTVCLFASASAPAQKQPKLEQNFSNHIFRPAEEKPDDKLIAGLKLPGGFKISKFADDLEKPRMLAVAPNGDVYVTRRDPLNDVWLLRDTNGDGTADERKQVAQIKDVHGIALRDGKVYLAATRELFVADILPDGTFGSTKALYNDLPDAGQHPNRTLAFDKTGELFLSVGSTCDACWEPNKENATMLLVKTDGSGRAIFATGLRNTIGFDWHPKTGELWGMDHGIDWLGDDSQKEELNRIEEGKKYGWPFVFEDGKRNPADNPQEYLKISWDEYARQCEPPGLTYDAHSAPMALLFYTGSQFPEQYRESAFVTFHGSWNRNKPSGYKVMHLKFKDGKPEAFENFLTGFLIKNDTAQFGRPVGLAMAKDGALLVSDDSGGGIYRISYGGTKAASQ
ncbi:MAG: PQQ-dependent sugar dehydrogenase [Verrucomicrobiota bacterium]|nr:PQQ-dependent sugar dehydrogenase [Verrucomicrobiota bacterium]